MIDPAAVRADAPACDEVLRLIDAVASASCDADAGLLGAPPDEIARLVGATARPGPEARAS